VRKWEQLAVLLDLHQQEETRQPRRALQLGRLTLAQGRLTLAQPKLAQDYSWRSVEALLVQIRLAERWWKILR